MYRRHCPLLIGAVALCHLTAAAAEPSKVLKTVEKLTSNARPEVALYYSRAIAPEGLSDFRSFVGVQLALGGVIDPTFLIRASLSLDREIGAPIEAFRASNTTVSAAKLFNLQKIGWLRSTLFVRLPTHDEDRQYLSYRGTFGTSVGVFNQRVFAFSSAHTLGGSFSLTTARNLFQYTTSQEGAIANRLWSFSAGASLIYTAYEKFSVILGFQNNLFWTWQGRDNDRYQLSAAIQYLAPYDLRLTLSTLTADRTFQYDQTSLNVNLYKPENTQLVFNIAYAPNFEQL